MPTSIQRISQTLATAGVPANGITITGPTSAVIGWYTADDQQGLPTQAQKDLGAAVLAAFDWSDAAEQAYQDTFTPEKAALRNAVVQMVADIDTFLAIGNAATAAQVRTATLGLATDMRRVIVYLAKQING